MPQIRIIRPDQQNRDISSGNPELIGRWFAEVLAEYPRETLNGDYWRLEIYPLWKSDPKDPRGGKPDVPFQSHAVNGTAETFTLHGLITELEKIVKEYE